MQLHGDIIIEILQISLRRAAWMVSWLSPVSQPLTTCFSIHPCPKLCVPNRELSQEKNFPPLEGFVPTAITKTIKKDNGRGKEMVTKFAFWAMGRGLGMGGEPVLLLLGYCTSSFGLSAACQCVSLHDYFFSRMYIKRIGKNSISDRVSCCKAAKRCTRVCITRIISAAPRAPRHSITHITNFILLKTWVSLQNDDSPYETDYNSSHFPSIRFIQQFWQK